MKHFLSAKPIPAKASPPYLVSAWEQSIGSLW
jgi:hypothetical protein